MNVGSEELAEDLFGRRRSGKEEEMSVSEPKFKLADCRETRVIIFRVSKLFPTLQKYSQDK